MRARRLARGLPTRGLGEKGGRGAWLDPLCDKTFVLSVILAVWWFYDPAWWLLLLIGVRELLLVPMVLAWRLLPHRPLDMRAGIAGKLATVAQFLALWSILLGVENQIVPAFAAAVAGVIAVVDYARRAFRASR
jgi:phosphatidylglycerophosphate synthase